MMFNMHFLAMLAILDFNASTIALLAHTSLAVLAFAWVPACTVAFVAMGVHYLVGHVSSVTMAVAVVTTLHHNNLWLSVLTWWHLVTWWLLVAHRCSIAWWWLLIPSHGRLLIAWHRWSVAWWWLLISSHWWLWVSLWWVAWRWLLVTLWWHLVTWLRSIALWRHTHRLLHWHSHWSTHWGHLYKS